MLFQSFFKARSVPYAMKDKVEKELMILMKEGVIEEVTTQNGQLQLYPS